MYYVVVNNLIIKECKDYKMVNRVIENSKLPIKLWSL